MSIVNNTSKLQELLDKVNTLPEAESLDEELETQGILLSEQDSKIAELAEILAGKAGGGGGHEWIQLSSLPTTYAVEPTQMYYLEVADNTRFLLAKSFSSVAAYAWDRDNSAMSGTAASFLASCTFIKDGDLSYIQISNYTYKDANDVFVLPITI